MPPCFEPHVVSRFLASCVLVCSPLEVHSSCAIICPWPMLRIPLVLLYPSSYYGSSFLKRIRLARVASSALVGLGQDICPVSALLQYLSLRGDTTGSLFIWRDGSPLSPSQVNYYLRDLLSRAVVPGTYSRHSFRTGPDSIPYEADY